MKVTIAILSFCILFVGCASHSPSAPDLTGDQLHQICVQLFDLVQMYQLDHEAQLELIRAEMRKLTARVDRLER